MTASNGGSDTTAFSNAYQENQDNNQLLDQHYLTIWLRNILYYRKVQLVLSILRFCLFDLVRFGL